MAGRLSARVAKSVTKPFSFHKEPFKFTWEDRTNMRNTMLMGTVVSKKMKKTPRVLVKQLVLHRTLLKYYTHRRRYFAHDPEDQVNIGDVVIIRNLRFVEQSWVYKRHVISEVVERAPFGIDPVTGREFTRNLAPVTVAGR